MLPIGHNIQQALAAQTLAAPYTSDASGSGSSSSVAQFLTLATDASLTNERVFTPGNALSAVDAGAGGTYTLNLQTPGTLSVSSSNAAAGNHTHAITSSSNPGAAAGLLASDGSGNLTLVGLKANTTTFALANTTATTVNAFGAATTTNLGPSSGSAVIQPNASYVTSLGAVDHKWAQLYAAELVVETLVQQDVIATTGGRVLVGPTTSLIADVAAGDTSISVKHNNLRSGDRVFLQANSVFEAMAITSAPSVVTGGYSYTVTRNLDGWGAQTWHSGDAVFNTGQTGNGFIDLYSQYSVLGLAPDYVFNHDAAGNGTPFEAGNYSANYASSANWTPFADNSNTEVGDSIYFGVAGGSWSNLYFNLTTAAVYSATLVWEFWNGAAWTSFVPSFVGNPSGDFKATGWQGFEWTASSLTGWASKTINSLAAFWVRVRLSARTSWTTNPSQTGLRVIRNNANVGPTIIGWKRNSSTWNDLTPSWAVGNMAGLYGVTASVPGIGLGDFAGGNYLKYDTGGGFRLVAGAGAVALDANGIVIESGSGAPNLITFHSTPASADAGSIGGYLPGGTTPYTMFMSANGPGVVQLTAANGSGFIRSDITLTGSSETVLLATGSVLSHTLTLNSSTGVSVSDGLNVGTASGAGIGSISLSGGLNVGTASAAATGQVLISGGSTDPVVQGTITNADTAAYRVGVSINHGSSGTPAAGFGMAFRTQLHSSTNTMRVASDIATTWATATDASYKARTTFYVYDAGVNAREYMRGESSGAAAKIGFLGAAAVVAQTAGSAAPSGGTGVAAGGWDTSAHRDTAITLINNIRTGLLNLGLFV